MQTWAKIGVVLIVVAVVAAWAQQTQSTPKVTIQCKANGDAGSCVFENKGSRAGNVEADVVLVCRDGEHLAHVSAFVEANNHVTKIIDGFAPSVGLLTSCAGIDYRNVTVK